MTSPGRGVASPRVPHRRVNHLVVPVRAVEIRAPFCRQPNAVEKTGKFPEVGVKPLDILSTWLGVINLVNSHNDGSYSEQVAYHSRRRALPTGPAGTGRHPQELRSPGLPRDTGWPVVPVPVAADAATSGARSCPTGRRRRPGRHRPARGAAAPRAPAPGGRPEIRVHLGGGRCAGGGSRGLAG